MSEVPPTRMNQQVFKGKKKAAESGHRLLKKKADALKVRFFRWSVLWIFGDGSGIVANLVGIKWLRFALLDALSYMENVHASWDLVPSSRMGAF